MKVDGQLQVDRQKRNDREDEAGETLRRGTKISQQFRKTIQNQNVNDKARMVCVNNDTLMNAGLVDAIFCGRRQVRVKAQRTPRKSRSGSTERGNRAAERGVERNETCVMEEKKHGITCHYS